MSLPDDSVCVIDGITNTVIAIINLSSTPNAVAVNPSTDAAYVTNQGSTVSVLDGKCCNSYYHGS